VYKVDWIFFNIDAMNAIPLQIDLFLLEVSIIFGGVLFNGY
jgi:hypothetical protein